VILGLVVDRRGDARIELDVPAQVKLVRYIIEVALVLRLAGIMLFPVPFLQEFLRERISVGVTFGVERASRIAILIPGAAHSTTILEGPHREPELTQTVQLIQPGNPGADDNRVELLDLLGQWRAGCRRLLFRDSPYRSSYRSLNCSSCVCSRNAVAGPLVVVNAVRGGRLPGSREMAGIGPPGTSPGSVTFAVPLEWGVGVAAE